MRIISKQILIQTRRATYENETYENNRVSEQNRQTHGNLCKNAFDIKTFSPR